MRAAPGDMEARWLLLTACHEAGQAEAARRLLAALRRDAAAVVEGCRQLAGP